MKTSFAILTAMLLLNQSQAQAATAERVAGVVRREFVSPEVNEDRTVTVRVRAPEAKQVKVSGEWRGETNLTNSDGVWSATIGPLEPDIYGYSLVIDGLTIPDPSNPWVKPMRAARTSVLEVPGNPSEMWEFRAVPHGSVHEHFYWSTSLHAKRRLHVYTPPGYEKSSKKLPLLVLLHGSGDNDATWTAVGRANFIADNLLAEHKAKPMVIVMLDGHAFSGNPTQVGTNLISRNVDAFSDDLLKDALPLVEANYRLLTDRDNRAIIGLSMGGGQSLTIGLKHHERFAWVGGMSSYLPNFDSVLSDSFPKGKSDLKLLWIACGKDDRLMDNARKLSERLKEKNIPHTLRETAGNHSWPVWRRHLIEFMPLLFAQK